MRALRFALLALVRDWKSGELTVLMLALIVAVGALTAVGFFTNRVNQAVEVQAAEVLGADLRLQSNEDLGDKYLAEARKRGLKTARTLGMLSVVFKGERSQLTALRSVGEGYPLRGKVRIADAPFAPARVTEEIPARGEVWADARLLATLDANVGDTVSVGAATFRVTRVLDYRPDQGSTFTDLAPDLLMHVDDVPSTELVQPGSRLRYANLFAGTPKQVASFRTWLQENRKLGERLRDIEEASPQIRASSDRAGRFLNLAGLVSVLLAAIAVAMAARRYAQRHLDNVALMKCMGASQGFILRLSMLELLLLALVAAATGTLLGYLAQEGLAWLLQDLIRGDLPPPTRDAAYLGLVTAVAVLTGFALPPLLQLRDVPPVRVLRRNMEPPPLAYSITYGLAIAAIFGMLLWLVRDWKLVGAVAAGAAGTLAVLMFAGWLLVKLLSRLRGGVGVAWRYGLANISRRGRESIVQIVAFGLGLMVLLLLAVVRDDLLEDWRASLPPDAPNHFLINIRPDERAGLQQFFTERGVKAPTLFPMIRARLTTINGKTAAEMKELNDRGQNFAEREQNLTWAAEPQKDNEIVAGRWWTEADHGKPLVSIATEYQQEMGLKIGDKLGFDVAGEQVEVTIASVRKVQWDSFQPNFFLVFPPGVLEGVAGTYMTAIYLDPEQRRSLVELVRRFPSVSIFDLDALMKQVREVMDKASLAVQYVFLFTLAAGITVLLAAIQSTRDERRYESAMLRTLGATRRTVLQGVAAEFAALGLLAGTLAAFGATTAGYFIATELFNLDYTFDPMVWVIGLVFGVLLVGVSGTLATRSVVNHPPVATLRQN
ncbi:MAG TPA: FtsX-like permease family protein [Steroidobacteraceae bacterium]|nr:FtsX-like permease family protein [Steroidobacteraceae bacterium]